jgi:hypothetical protein
LPDVLAPDAGRPVASALLSKAVGSDYNEAFVAVRVTLSRKMSEM